jgi:membrane-associated phospholipid phosphatase
LYYPVIVAINWTVTSPRHFLYVVISYMVLLGFQMAFFTLLPVATPLEWRTCNAGRGRSERFLAFVQSLDAPSNSFPSMHTSVAMLTAMHLFPAFGPIVFAFPLLIAASCLFTKQHYVVDLPVGAVLGWFVFKLFQLTY